MSSSTVPQIFDAWKRVARTVIQTGIPAFLTFAAAVPALLEQAHVFVSPRLYASLLVLATGITVVAGILTRIMAIPAVNELLTRFGLGGHSGNVVAQDTYTRALLIQRPAGTLDPSEIAAGPQPGIAGPH